MANDSMTLNVDKNLVERVILNKIQAEVAASLDAVKDDLIQRMVTQVLTQKVNEQGNPDSSWNAKHELLEVLIQKELKVMVIACLKTFVEKNRTAMEKRIHSAMRASQGKFVSAFMASMEKQLSDSWSVKVEVGIDKNK